MSLSYGSYQFEREDEDRLHALDFYPQTSEQLAYPTPCSSLREGGNVLLQGCPCRINKLSYTTSHRSAVQIVGTNLLTGEMRQDIFPVHESVFVPRVHQEKYIFNSCDRSGRMNLYNDQHGRREDIRVPRGEIGARIRQANEEGRSLMLEITEFCGEAAATRVLGSVNGRAKPVPRLPY
ncbi:Translation initiation factor [Aspergillus alliaceus]|uniref:Translation initiation factor n=1 Tax=Petromyces alliaceus TaxID=209559 RepID=A0A5N6G9W2_PETAA|nr:uncharacterized protein BDW43DRAFT_305690 [Aspergillus alliaceus]KAB8238788.1 hypothetical protein BDW43DRAFT_305690 [Aspergillus alliaceus]KAE8394381.1 hypothetical protein BDV23DRAFT_147827 [Aspergillus alliaceus]KAF5855905.1 Translation initiation factor [Aspergillus burnettii]